MVVGDNMSKLVKAIKATRIGKEYGHTSPITDIQLEATQSYSHITYDRVIEYVMKASFGTKMIVDEGRTRIQHDANLVEAEKSVKLAMIEEVFGEFRPFFRELELASYNEDRRGIRDVIARFFNKMYTEI